MRTNKDVMGITLNILKDGAPMKLSDMIISALIKRGVLCEARNVDVEFDIPGKALMMVKDEGVVNDKPVKIHLKSEHITLRIEKEGSTN